MKWSCDIISGQSGRVILRTLLSVISIIIAANLIGAGPAEVSPATNVSFSWKAYWGGGDPELQCLKLKQTGFNAFMVWRQDIDYLKKLAQAGKKHGVETYFSVGVNYDKTYAEDLKQVMSPDEQVQYSIIKTNKISSLCAMEYQWGGEPVGKKEVHEAILLCFHRPEVLEKNKNIIKNILDNVPEITGLAIDGLGYQNYHCCYCDYSMKLFEEYRGKHKDLSKEEALSRFSLDSLVDFNNQLVKYARSIKPDIKTTCHIYPVFLPEPLYGYRLDVDYCGETVAWFFKPFWTKQKIGDYTKQIVKNQGKCFINQKAVAMLGLFSEARCRKNGYNCLKSAEQIGDEMTAIKKAGCDKIMFCCFNIETDKEITEILAQLLK